ncbi:MAG: hypothetical protein ACLGI3_11495 [Actinomycetes bacterium]
MKGAALALLAVLTAACGGTPPSAPSASSAEPPGVPGMAAEVVLLRTDEAIGGQVQVRVTDTGDAPFTVTAVRLDSAGFRMLPAMPVEAAFVPGRTIDLPTPYGEPICSAAPLPAVAELALVRPGGAVEDVRVPMSAEVLRRIHDRECAARAVLEVVGIEVRDLREEGGALRGVLVLSRRAGDQPVTASRMGRSVLIDVVADELPLELVGRQSSAQLTFRPATCDPHVLSETKKPYVFPLHVAVGDGEPVVLDLPLDAAARDRLAAMVQRVCAPGS